ncbi:hypothetical protein BDE36_4639 [Arcticibacter tournemirensis]|nr:hypothetical protein BDE36_4639 [Arcticibacter tournemirensis]
MYIDFKLLTSFIAILVQNYYIDDEIMISKITPVKCVGSSSTFPSDHLL